jgi:hypothetical protein
MEMQIIVVGQLEEKIVMDIQQQLHSKRDMILLQSCWV